VKLASDLTIGANGAFTAHDLIVTSIDSNSFTGTVWGITYTVNTASSTNSGNGGRFYPAFYLRGGDNGGTFNLDELQVGDQLGVSGTVASSSPLVVNATVVRDYSVTTVRPQPTPMPMPWQGNGGGYGNNGTSSGNQNGTSAYNGIQGRLTNIIKQFQGLRAFFGAHFGGGR
jgi:hypothetical protein